ncbi:MAG: hypothetical protein ACREMB_22060, partial [Candidatus Rokuibacteriota bacterium]
MTDAIPTPEQLGAGRQVVSTATQVGDEHAPRSIRVVLVSTYELGRQPFGVASATALLRQAGASVTCLDLAVDRLDFE